MRWEHQYMPSGMHRLVAHQVMGDTTGEWTTYEGPAYIRLPAGTQYICVTAYLANTLLPDVVYEITNRSTLAGPTITHVEANEVIL